MCEAFKKLASEISECARTCNREYVCGGVGAAGEDERCGTMRREGRPGEGGTREKFLAQNKCAIIFIVRVFRKNKI